MIRFTTRRTPTPIARRWDSVLRRLRAYAPERVARRALRVRREALALVRARHGWSSRLSVALHAALRATFTNAFPMTVVRIQVRSATTSRGPSLPMTLAPSASGAPGRGEVALPSFGRRQRGGLRTTRDVVPARVVAQTRVVRVPDASSRRTPAPQQRARPQGRPQPRVVLRVGEGRPTPVSIAPASRARPRVLLGAVTRTARLVAMRPLLSAGAKSAGANAVVRGGATASLPPRGADAARPAATHIPMEVVRRGRTTSPTATTPAFSASALPLLAQAPATSAASEFPMERIERTLRESLVTVTERTVQREVERTLRAGAPMARRLRESIQAEIYDDVVLERERRGGGGR